MNARDKAVTALSDALWSLMPPETSHAFTRQLAANVVDAVTEHVVEQLRGSEPTRESGRYALTTAQIVADEVGT